MKKLNLIIFVLAIMFASSAFADEQSHRKLAEEMLLTIKLDKQLEGAYEQVKAVQKERIKNMEHSEEAMAVQDKMFNADVAQLVEQRFRKSWVTSSILVVGLIFFLP